MTTSLPKPEETGASYFDVASVLAALSEGAPVLLPPLEVVLAQIEGRAVRFACNFERDPIQREHRKGRFYEAEELADVTAHLPNQPRILDVGANVGNHALYWALSKGAQVVVVEPNPLAQAPLVANVVLNDLQSQISLDHLGVALSDKAASGFYMKRHDRNLGATKLKAGGGDLETIAGDDLCADMRFDLIKIDVEGMEMEVLRGLQGTIKANAPLIMIEISPDKTKAFRDWMAEHEVRVLKEYDRGNHANYLLQTKTQD